MELNCIYYPYTAIHSLDTLTVALLYFDKIWLLSPRSIFRGRKEYRDEVNDSLMKLENERLVRLAEPRETLSEYGEVFSRLVRNDLALGIYNKLDSRPFKLYAEKVTEEIHREFLSDQRIDSGVFSVPFNLGEAIIINHITLLCNRYSLVPFTDERIHRLALISKIRSIQEMMQIKSKPVEVRITLPALAGVDLDDMIDLRKATSLIDFRKTLSEVSSFVQHESLDSYMWMRISQLPDEMSENLRSIREILRKFQKQRKQQGVILTGLPMTISIHVGTPWRTRPFEQANNGLSFFIDIRRMLPDRASIGNVSRIVEETVDRPSKTIRKGEATVEDLLKALKLRTQT